MRARMLVVGALTVALAIPALAQGQPNRYQLVTTIPAGKTADLTVGTLPTGELAFGLRASSDGEKILRLTQKRDNGTRFTVLRIPSATAASACQGAAGSVICSGITTPATPAGHRWNFRVRNGSNRPMSITLTIRWRPVPSAG
jgi:hypothetical protein